MKFIKTLSGQYDRDIAEYQAALAKKSRNGKDAFLGVDVRGKEIYEGDRVRYNDWDWYYANREKRIARNRQYREEHREELLLKKKIYRITGKYPKGKLT